MIAAFKKKSAKLIYDHDHSILKKEYTKLIFVGSRSSQKCHQEVKPLKCYDCSIKIQIRQDPT